MFEVKSLGLVPYDEAWDMQKELVQKIDKKEVEDHLLLLEHPPTITLGRGTDKSNLLYSVGEYNKNGIQVVEIDRGGDVTYHGPGQLVGYPLFSLVEKGLGANTYLRFLEECLIVSLSKIGIEGTRKSPLTGVWVKDKKIAAIGVKFNFRRHGKGYITSHGFALNVNPDMSYYNLIVPCGIKEYGVTSLKELGFDINIEEIGKLVKQSFEEVLSNL